MTFLRQPLFGPNGQLLRDAHFGHVFNMVDGMHPTAMRRIFESFGSFEAAWSCRAAADGEKFAKAGLSDWLVKNVVEMLVSGTIDPSASARELFEQGIMPLSRGDDGFPLPLRGIKTVPVLLYHKGAPFQPEKRYIAVVGTRDPSPYGETVTQELAGELSRAGAVVVSGMAVGIDSIAHQQAVAEKNPTIAVLACGLGNEHAFGGMTYRQQKLAEKILDTGGTLFSEYCDSAAYKGRFLERNRLISGLSEATIVVEAGEQSGALSTARYATEQNKDVYAVPGDIYREQAQGPLGLLADGDAFICTNVTQLLDQMGFPLPSARREAQLEGDFLALFSALAQPLSFDGLVRKTRLSPGNVSVALTILEAQKLIAKRADGLWWKTR